MSIELGKFNQLKVVKFVDFGLYLDGGDDGEILLPLRYVPEGVKEGDELNFCIWTMRNDLLPLLRHPWYKLENLLSSK